MGFDPTKGADICIEAESAILQRRPRTTVEHTTPPPTVGYPVPKRSPEQVALREAAKAELNRRIQRRREWALDLIARGEELPVWLSTDASNDYSPSGTAIT